MFHPSPAARRRPPPQEAFESLDGVRYLPNWNFLDVDQDGAICVADIVEALSVEVEVAAAWMLAASREVGFDDPTVHDAIPLASLMRAGSKVLRRLLAMASATWLFNSPGEPRQATRFVDVSRCGTAQR